MSRIGTWSLVLLLITAGAPGLRAQRTHTNGGAAVERNGVVVTKLAGHTLYIPKGYVSSFMGYAGYLEIHALLPCLLPETEANTNQFHQNTFGHVLRAVLNPFSDAPYRIGQNLLENHVKNSEYYLANHGAQNPGRKVPESEIGPISVPNSKLTLYRDLLLKEDVFVLPDSKPLLVVTCSRRTRFVRYPICLVREKILQDIHIQYSYDRSFVDISADNAAEIDHRLRNLIRSFLTQDRVNGSESCKQ